MMTQTPLAAPASFARGTRPSASPYSLRSVNRRIVAVRAEKGPLEQIEEKTQEFVEQTKENSGLDFDKLNKQPGFASDKNVGTSPQQAEVFSFSGLLPEIINGRAAMFAMLAAFAAEVRTGAPLFVQIQQAPVAIAAAFATIIIASVIPVVRGANLDRDGAGPFTQKAEVLNGRLAMVSFALLIGVETWKAGPGLKFF